MKRRMDVIFIYFSDAWRRRRKLLFKNRERNQEIRNAKLGTEFENNPEAEVDPPYQNDQAVELRTDFENDPVAEVGDWAPEWPWG